MRRCAKVGCFALTGRSGRAVTNLPPCCADWRGNITPCCERLCQIFQDVKGWIGAGFLGPAFKRASLGFPFGDAPVENGDFMRAKKWFSIPPRAALRSVETDCHRKAPTRLRRPEPSDCIRLAQFFRRRGAYFRPEVVG